AAPAGMQKAEICSRSGLLATDKCYDAVKSADGETVRRRTTYTEIATSAQMPTEPCNVHGEVRARLVRDLPASGFPRASLAVDPKQVSPVAVKGPVLLAENDPYNAVNSTVKPKPPPEKEKPEADKSAPKEEESMPDPTKPVLKAKPVEPDETKPIPKAEAVEPDSAKPILKAIPVEPTPPNKEIRRAKPVHPADEIPSDQILKPTPPPPADLGD
ncbi:MAG TPA: hypothetical protein VK581_10410, partial [Chthoniobacterales bacterium]|nr:hypothetical protein [Chthoniobacterales bacterium]